MAEEPDVSEPDVSEPDVSEPDVSGHGPRQPERLGLRERHKVETRAALQAAALELFHSRSFQATTVAMVAEAAGVSERTLFRYFESKDDLLLGEVTVVLGEVRDALARRPNSEPPIVAVREAIVEVLVPRDFSLARLASREIVDLGTSRFVARLRSAMQAWESDVAVLLVARAGGIIRRADLAVIQFEAAVVAAAATAALRAVLTRRAQVARDGVAASGEAARGLEWGLRSAFSVLEHGCRIGAAQS